MLKYIILILSLSTGACSNMFKLKTPEWFNQLPDASFCGVGVAKVNNDLGVARELAAVRAHKDLAQQIELRFTETTNLVNSDGKLGTTSLQGSVIKFVTIESEYLFLLTCLEPDKLVDALDKMKRLNYKQREALRKRAQIEYDELDKELKKLRNSEDKSKEEPEVVKESEEEQK